MKAEGNEIGIEFCKFKKSRDVRKITLYLLLIFDAFLGLLFGPFLFSCLILFRIMKFESLALLPIIALGFYILIGTLQFLRLIKGGKVIITDWYMPEIFLTKRGCRIIERRKLRLLGFISAEEYYLVECMIYGRLLKMAVITNVFHASYPKHIYFGNIHIIFEGDEKCFELLNIG